MIRTALLNTSVLDIQSDLREGQTLREWRSEREAAARAERSRSRRLGLRRVAVAG